MGELVLGLIVNKGEEYSLKTIIHLFGDVQCQITGSGRLEVILYSPEEEDNLRIMNLLSMMPGIQKVIEKYPVDVEGKIGKELKNSFVGKENVFSVQIRG